MPFDIANASVFEQMSLGSFLHLTDPTGKLLYDDAGAPVGIKLRGRNSYEALEVARLVGNKRLADARRPGGGTMTVESNERSNAEVLAACVVEWSFTELDGQPFPPSYDNAVKFFADDRFRRFRDLADDFVSAEANFTKG